MITELSSNDNWWQVWLADKKKMGMGNIKVSSYTWVSFLIF